MPGGILLPSEARTATKQTDQVTFPAVDMYRGVMLALDITATPNNAETLTLSVQAYDLASKKYVPLTAFAAGKTGTELGAAPTTATSLFTVYPAGAETAAIANAEVQAMPIPNKWRAVVTHSAGGSWTYTLSYQPLA
jgi:hypothetical protein